MICCVCLYMREILRGILEDIIKTNIGASSDCQKSNVCFCLRLQAKAESESPSLTLSQITREFC